MEVGRSTPIVKRKRGRPRKQVVPIEESQIDETIKRKRESDSEPECPRKKFRRRLTKSDFNESDDSTSPNESKPLKNYTYVPVEVDRRKGKKEYSVSEEDFQKALEIVNVVYIGKKSAEKQKEYDNARMTITRYFNDKETVTCGKCGKEMPPRIFQIHNKKRHYNLGWRVGEPEVVSLLRKYCLCQFLLCPVPKFPPSQSYLIAEAQ